MIYLVRHGQSECNLLRRTQGQIPHPPLTDLGRRQAFAAAQAIRADVELNSQPVRSVIASDLVRAVQTAQIVAGAVTPRSTWMGAGVSSASDGSKGWGTGRLTPSWPVTGPARIRGSAEVNGHTRWLNE